MFNPERLLGGLLMQAAGSALGMRTSRRRGSRRGFSSAQGAIGMGLLGAAIGAFEHFSKSQTAPQTAAPMPQSQPRPHAAPPPPRRLPPAAAKASQSVTLIRAMFAAAAADGSIDDEERGQILSQVDSLGLSAEERGFVETEMRRPYSLEQLVAEVKGHGSSADFLEQVYLASLVGCGAVSEGERAYVGRLAQSLAIPPERRRQLETALGLTI